MTLDARQIRTLSADDQQASMVGQRVFVDSLNPDWWRGRLSAHQGIDESTTIEIVEASGAPPARWATLPSPMFSLHGTVREVRAVTHHKRLMDDSGLTATTTTIEGTDAVVSNPFRLLPRVLQASAANQYLALAHGDLNPRNILMVTVRGGTLFPCVIDYALTGDNQPLLLDFVKLELSVARDALPPLSWADNVRLQRIARPFGAGIQDPLDHQEVRSASIPA